MNTQPEALRLADRQDKGPWLLTNKDAEETAALLRTQHADIERKDALLRQALDALTESVDYVREDYRTNWRHGVPSRQRQLDGLHEAVKEHEAAIDAIKQELSK